MATIQVSKAVIGNGRELIKLIAEGKNQVYKVNVLAMHGLSQVDLEVPAGEYRIYVKNAWLPMRSKAIGVMLKEDDVVAYTVRQNWVSYVMFIILMVALVVMGFVYKFFNEYALVFTIVLVVTVILTLVYLFILGRDKAYVLEQR